VKADESQGRLQKHTGQYATIEPDKATDPSVLPTSSIVKDNSSKAWYIDFGKPRHMAYKFEWFKNLTDENRSVPMKLGDNRSYNKCNKGECPM
jgi:hypothetical protein